jgi:predicted nucleic acid-binding protein
VGDVSPAARPLVLDTNIVLDLFVFGDPATLSLRALLDGGGARWIATPVMRDELARVLEYPHLQPRLTHYGLQSADVLAQFDRHAQLVAPAPKAGVICTDRDDQKFIDLAIAHRGLLLSKDAAVLKTRKRAARHDTEIAKALAASSYSLSGG